MAVCAACRRPVALARASCLYCGAALPAESVAAAAEAASKARGLAIPGATAEEPEHELLIVEVGGQEAAVLGLPVQSNLL